MSEQTGTSKSRMAARLGHHHAGRAAARRDHPHRHADQRRRPASRRARAGAGSGRSGPGPGQGGFQGGPPGPFGGAGRWGSRAEARQAVRQEQGRPPRRSRNARPRGRGWPRTASAGAASAAAARGGGRGMAAGSPGPGAEAGRRQDLRDRAALRSRGPADDLPAVRERRLGAGARRLQQHRRRGARRGDRRRQDLQGTSACTSAACRRS